MASAGFEVSVVQGNAQRPSEGASRSELRAVADCRSPAVRGRERGPPGRSRGLVRCPPGGHGQETHFDGHTTSLTPESRRGRRRGSGSASPARNFPHRLGHWNRSPHPRWHPLGGHQGSLPLRVEPNPRAFPAGHPPSHGSGSPLEVHRRSVARRPARIGEDAE